MARQFFEGSAQGAGAGPSFAMPHQLPPADMGRIGEMAGRAGPNLSEAWAREKHFHQAAEESKARAAWAAEFGSSSQQSHPGPHMQQETAAGPDCKSPLVRTSMAFEFILF